MSRKKELEKIIADAEAELIPIKRRETNLKVTREYLEDFKNHYGLSYDDVRGILDNVYLTDQD